jgi:hypothetical protein
MQTTKQSFEETRKIHSEMVDFILCANEKAIENTPEWDQLKDIFFMIKISELQNENTELRKRIDSVIKILN